MLLSETSVQFIIYVLSCMLTIAIKVALSCHPSHLSHPSHQPSHPSCHTSPVTPITSPSTPITSPVKPVTSPITPIIGMQWKPRPTRYQINYLTWIDKIYLDLFLYLLKPNINIIFFYALSYRFKDNKGQKGP